MSSTVGYSWMWMSYVQFGSFSWWRYICYSSAKGPSILCTQRPTDQFQVFSMCIESIRELKRMMIPSPRKWNIWRWTDSWAAHWHPRLTSQMELWGLGLISDLCCCFFKTFWESAGCQSPKKFQLVKKWISIFWTRKPLHLSIIFLHWFLSLVTSSTF